MRFLPESNGLHRVRRKIEIKPSTILKRVVFFIIGILIVGFIFQFANNFIGKEAVKARLDYTRIDGKKMEYDYQGNGDFTVIFDGSIGGNLYEWDEIAREVREDYGVRTFIYNRQGYGFNDGGDQKTPEEQAADLKILLRKAAASGPYILVGEEYGSLVMTNFAKAYPDEVKGAVLIKPIDESIMETEEFKKKYKSAYYRSSLESLGCNFGLTYMMDKLNWDLQFKDFENSLRDGANEDYAVHKTKSNYRQALKNEYGNLYKGKSDSQKEELFKGKPMYIISDTKDSNLSKLGSKDLTTIFATDVEGEFIPLKDSKMVKNSISKVLEECRRIERHKSGKE